MGWADLLCMILYLGNESYMTTAPALWLNAFRLTGRGATTTECAGLTAKSHSCGDQTYCTRSKADCEHPCRAGCIC